VVSAPTNKEFSIEKAKLLNACNLTLKIISLLKFTYKKEIFA